MSTPYSVTELMQQRPPLASVVCILWRKSVAVWIKHSIDAEMHNETNLKSKCQTDDLFVKVSIVTTKPRVSLLMAVMRRSCELW